MRVFATLSILVVRIVLHPGLSFHFFGTHLHANNNYDI